MRRRGLLDLLIGLVPRLDLARVFNDLRAPLIAMSKADIVRRGTELGVDLGRTCSCYDPGPRGMPCGGCDACLLRAKGFAEAGLSDPLLGNV